MIGSSGHKGTCYIETKNLDGETNLKQKKAPSACVSEATTEYEIINNFNKAIIECDPHNEFLYKFDGSMKFNKFKSESNLSSVIVTRQTERMSINMEADKEEELLKG